MNAETDAFYGRDEPSATYKWGVVIDMSSPLLLLHGWQVVAWFKTRKRAEEYARRRLVRAYAIARGHWK